MRLNRGCGCGYSIHHYLKAIENNSIIYQTGNMTNKYAVYVKFNSLWKSCSIHNTMVHYTMNCVIGFHYTVNNSSLHCCTIYNYTVR